MQHNNTLEKPGSNWKPTCN